MGGKKMKVKMISGFNKIMKHKLGFTEILTQSLGGVHEFSLLTAETYLCI